MLLASTLDVLLLVTRHFVLAQLYGDYADKFDLSECKLAIVHCAGHYDPTLVESLWTEIITEGTVISEGILLLEMICPQVQSTLLLSGGIVYSLLTFGISVVVYLFVFPSVHFTCPPIKVSACLTLCLFVVSLRAESFSTL